MIKLIATDMDGTLLDSNSKLPENFYDTYNKLYEMGIKFVVASGRPYLTLRENFKPIASKLDFICDNGAYIVESGKEPKISIIEKAKVNELIETCKSIPNTELLLCGIKGAYRTNIDPKFIKEIDKYYVNQIVVDDLTKVDDDIFKVTVCDFNISAENSYKVFYPKFKNELKVVISGKVWLDITNINVNKGAALSRIKDDFNISYDETMAFGDFYNDIELLKEAKYSFVMENANDDMKKYGNYIAKKNTENGVVQAIEEYIFSNQQI
ncbi:MAG: HAD family hydrolase [Clostridiaceae bacterium]|nr:HAD family hydrolase [Clostridiaceae bacterium]